MSQVILIVGQSFVTGTMPEGVHGISEFVSALRQGHYDDAITKYALLFGQGINSYDERFVCDELDQRALSKRFFIQRRSFQKSPRSFVHKHLEKNVLIVDFEAVGENHFRGKLSVDADSELLLDHTSGWHVPGMVILEAIRQMALAATENCGALSHLGRNRDFVIRSWNTTFENFLFPLDSEIICTILPIKTLKAKRLELRAEISIMQDQRPVTEAEIDFAVYEHDILNSIEGRFAQTALRKYIQANTPVGPDTLSVGV